MLHQSKKLISVGRIGSPHGVKGWVKIHSFTEPPENILHYLPWQLFKSGHYQTVKINHCRSQDKSIMVQLENCNDRDLAATYTNAEILIAPDQLPKLPVGEYYWSELEGLNVQTKDGRSLGKIESIFATGANDVLVVVGTKKRLIPYLRQQVILNIDLDAQIMTVDWDPDF